MNPKTFEVFEKLMTGTDTEDFRWQLNEVAELLDTLRRAQLCSEEGDYPTANATMVQMIQQRVETVYAALERPSDLLDILNQLQVLGDAERWSEGKGGAAYASVTHQIQRQVDAAAAALEKPLKIADNRIAPLRHEAC